MWMTDHTDGSSLVIQVLRICLPMQELWFRSLVMELRSCMPQSNILKRQKAPLPQ